MSTGADARQRYEFGTTSVVRPKGKHQATVVWLHGLGDNGSTWSQMLETISPPNIKWICPTASTQPISVFGRIPTTSWFDVKEISEDCPDDLDGLDATASHVANLLSNEPADIKLGVAGFSMGAAAALYSATAYAAGKYSNGKPYLPSLSSVVALSGWLPCAKILRKKIREDGSNAAIKRAETLPIFLCHGKVDEVVIYKFGEMSAHALTSNGFQNVTFKSYSGLGHRTMHEELDEVFTWLTTKLGIDGN